MVSATKPFPDPNFNTTTGFFTHVNSLTYSWGTPLVCFSIAIVAFVILKTKGYRTSDSLSVSTFVAFLMSTFLWGAGVMDGRWMMTLLFLAIGSLIYSIFDN